ncbi:hypothetical protein D3C84_1143210 [compost metagenome]
MTRPHCLQVFAKLTGVLAMTGDHSGRADDADASVFLVQLATTGHGVLLQIVEADVKTDHCHHLALFEQGEGDTGDQRSTA